MKTLQTHPKRMSAGFSLIELLVVIAIVGTLVSMLMPALSKARARSRQLSCLVLLRQMQFASFTYANDNSQWLLPVFPGFNNPAFTPTTLSWAEPRQTRVYLELTPETPTYYAQAPSNRICPDATYTRTTANPDGSYNIRNSFGANYTEFMDWQYADLYLYSAKPPIWAAYRTNRLKAPSTKLAWGDALSPAIRGPNSSGYSGEKSPSPNDQIAFRHQDSVNLAMFDGHGQTLPRTQVDVSSITTAEFNTLWYPYK